MNRNMDASSILGTWKAELVTQVQVGGGAVEEAMELLFPGLLFSYQTRTRLSVE